MPEHAEGPTCSSEARIACRPQTLLRGSALMASGMLAIVAAPRARKVLGWP
jgi:hypothetical protein